MISGSSNLSNSSNSSNASSTRSNHCQGCERGHKKGKMSKSHSFIYVDDGWKMISGDTSAGSAQSRSNHCLVHPQLEINTLCNQDGDLVCSQCFVDFHNGHSFTPLKNVAPHFKDEIIPKLNQVSFPFFLLSLFLSFLISNQSQ